MSYNACIQILSSRTLCLKDCLTSIYRHYTSMTGYPIFVHYFDSIYDKKEIRDACTAMCPNVEFIRVSYFTPSHISSKELFYNRIDTNYARNFSIERKGYLHMCNFIMNMYGYPNTRLHEFDYIVCFDDDSGLTKKLPFDPVDVLTTKPYRDMAAFVSAPRSPPHQNHFDTRMGLWDFVKRFLSDCDLIPACHLLADLVGTDRDGERLYHDLPWADTYVIRTKMYETDLWKTWLFWVNSYGGIYKHRWGDNELMALFYMIYNEHPILDLGLVKSGHLNQGLFRHKQKWAPGVKDNSL